MRKGRPSTAALLALALSVVPAACGPGSQRGAFPARVEWPASVPSMELPVERCGAHFIVQATVNGRPDVPLLLDTGAGETHLDPALAGELDLDGRVDSLAVGGFTAFDFEFNRLDMAPLSAALGREVAGILGQPVFSEVSVTWDLAQGSVSLSRDTLPMAGDGVVEARVDRRPFVPVVIGADTLWLLIDTGSAYGLTLRDPDGLPLLSPWEVSGARMRVDGLHLVESARVDGDVAVGPLTLRDPVVNRAIGTDLVGVSALGDLTITVDGRSNRVRFQRTDAPLATPILSEGRWFGGFAVRPARDYATVEWVDRLAEAAGLQRGDRIVAVGGVPWAERGCGPVGGGTGGGELHLRVERGGRLLEIEVPQRVVHGSAG